MGRTRKNVILILLFLTLSVSVAFLAYLHFFKDRNLSGEWTAELDFTEEAAVAAFAWLQEIEAVSVSLEDMEFSMRDLTVRVNLTLEQRAGSEGTFCCSVLPESYEACRQQAYQALAASFRALLSERLRMAGYTGGTDQEAVEALAAEAFGMSTVSYLMSCGPKLLPELEELQAGYDGSGTFRTSDGILIRQYDADDGTVAREERYIRQGESLILIEEVDSAGDSENPVPFSVPYPALYLLEQISE